MLLAVAALALVIAAIAVMGVVVIVDAAPAYLLRDYRLPSAKSTVLIRVALERANYRVLGAQPGMSGEAVWEADTSASGGDIYVLPPGKSRGGIEMRWHDTQLVIELQAGDVS